MSEEVKKEEAQESHDEDILVETKEKEIRIRKWWMVPAVVASFVIGIIAIIAALAVFGAFDVIIEAVK